MAKKNINKLDLSKIPPPDRPKNPAHRGKVTPIVVDVDAYSRAPDPDAPSTLPPTIPDASMSPRASDVTPYTVNRVKELLAGLAALRRQPLKLYEPLPEQDRFHRSKAKERLVRGSNQSGKTSCAALEVAMIVTGQHPHLSGKKGGTPIKNGRAALVGFDLSHLGRVIYPKLFKGGEAIKLIRDLETGEYRAYRPWEPADAERSDQCKLSPLIPGAMIQGKVAWYDKKLQQPQKITLKNGWEIFFYSSEGEPPQGDSYDLIWIDEEINGDAWYNEAAARLMARKGRFIWSATPHVGGDALINLNERATEQVGRENPIVEEFFLTLAGNPHIDEAEKLALADKYKYNPEQYRVRVLGEYAAHGYLVYPEYSLKLQGYEASLLGPDNSVPADWCRWIVIDPGRHLLAVLFAAIPPKDDFVLLYDELGIEKAHAQKLGQQLEVKTRGQFFEGIIIDRHGSDRHDVGSGLHIEELYWQALKVNKIWDRVRRKSFIGGDADRTAGIETFRSWLVPVDGGSPRARFLTRNGYACLPLCDSQLTRWHYTRVKKEAREKPEERRRDFPDALRYLAMFNPKYRKPPPPTKPKSWAKRRLEEKRESQSEGAFVNFGPAGAPAA